TRGFCAPPGGSWPTSAPADGMMMTIRGESRLRDRRDALGLQPRGVPSFRRPLLDPRTWGYRGAPAPFRGGSGGLLRRQGGLDGGKRQLDRLPAALHAEPEVTAQLDLLQPPAKRVDRGGRRAVHSQDAIADLQAGALGRAPLQDGGD